MRTLLFPLILSLLCMFPGAASAEGPLRDRLRENIKDRIVERMENAPAPQPTASVTDKITTPGDYDFSVLHQNVKRLYRVHVPASYDGVKPVALLFAFHGGGGDMAYMANDEYYGLISKSEAEGFIVVFPNGYSKFRSGKLATWNAGECCGDARDRNIDDVGFVRKIVTNITGQMTVDLNKIFATGISNGGLMAYRLACEMPDVFRAVAGVAGTDNTTTCDPARPISILHIHAKNDTHVLFNGGAGADSFRDETKVTDFTSVPETISRWVDYNDCNLTPKRVLNVAGAYCDLHHACTGGARVKLCVTETGGHSWPGGYKPRGDETPSTAISANDMMWDFFRNLQ